MGSNTDSHADTMSFILQSIILSSKHTSDKYMVSKLNALSLLLLCLRGGLVGRGALLSGLLDRCLASRLVLAFRRRFACG